VQLRTRRPGNDWAGRVLDEEDGQWPLFDRGGQPEVDERGIAADLFAHRGPDGDGVWCDRVVYLGPIVTRLSAFDLGTKRDVSVPLPDGIDIGKGVLTSMADTTCSRQALASLDSGPLLLPSIVC